MSLTTLPSVSISNDDFQDMLRFARCIFQLENDPSYLQKVESILPEIAHLNPANASALMGYDFHLTPDGPKLIEINNNAAGLWSWKTKAWLEQPIDSNLQSNLHQRIDAMFPKQWDNIAILDEKVKQQFFYPEMQAYAKVLSENGRDVSIISPEDLKQKDDGYLYLEYKKVTAIYNRHTDFYLESEALKHIKNAYLHHKVEMSPHPRSYALVADKGRMVDWWKADFFKDVLAHDQQNIIYNIVPKIQKLANWDVDDVWLKRKKYVFKPTSSHGGKGVLIGKSLRNKRFRMMLETPQDIVVQEFVPAPLIEFDGINYKYDIRLYMCGEKLIGLAARLFQGSVTNFSHPNSGFYPVRII